MASYAVNKIVGLFVIIFIIVPFTFNKTYRIYRPLNNKIELQLLCDWHVSMLLHGYMYSTSNYH